MLGNKINTRFFLIYTTIIGLFTVFLILLIFSLFVCFLMDNIGGLSSFANVSLCGGAFFSGLFCGRFRRKKGLLEGFLCGISLYFSLILIGIFTFGFSLSIKKLLISAFFGSIGGVYGVNTKYPKKLYQ